MKDIFYSGGFLYNPKKNMVLLHHRDEKAPVNPDVWAFFGGTSEPNETPKECFKREIAEELSIDISLDEIIPLTDYMNTDLNTYRNVFYVVSELEKSQMKLNEGKDFDWVSLDNLDKYKLTELTKLDLQLFAQLKKSK